MDDRVEQEILSRLARIPTIDEARRAGFRQDRILWWEAPAAGRIVGLEETTPGGLVVRDRIHLDPGLWELRLSCPRPVVAQVPGEVQAVPGWPAASRCLTCVFSESYVGNDLLNRRRCRFNAPECPCVERNVLEGCDTGALSMLAWPTAAGATPALAIVVGGPAPWTGQAFQITQTAAGPATISYQQNVLPATLSDALYRVRGYVRGSISGHAAISVNTTSYYHTDLANVWTAIDVLHFVPAATALNVKLQITNAVLNETGEFGNLSIEVVDRSYGRWNNVLDTDYCSHWASSVAGCCQDAWWVLGEDTDVTAWGTPPGVLIGGPPGENVSHEAPRLVLVDAERTRFRAYIPPGSTLQAILRARAGEAR